MNNGKIKKRKNRSRIKLYLYKNTLTAVNLAGRNVINSQWPSKGGMGKRLKIAKKRFNVTTTLNSSGTRDEENTSGKNLNVRPNITAKAIFDAGPASATLAGPYFLSRKLTGLYGTGLAYPNMNPPSIKEISGRRTEPNMSRCFIGFRVSRPRFLAVGSPNELATAPWLTSWITTEYRRATIQNTVVNNDSIIFARITRLGYTSKTTKIISKLEILISKQTQNSNLKNFKNFDI